MNPLRRELINGVFVLVLASLMSAAFAAFQVSFNLQLWVLILIGLGIAVTGYVMFEVALGYMASTEAREREWLSRVGTPASLALGRGESARLFREAVSGMRPGSDLTISVSVPHGDLRALFSDENREEVYATIENQLRRGTIREYKRIVCFEHDLFANDPDLRAGVLRVGDGPGAVTSAIGKHCRVMLETRGCSLFVAPVVVRGLIALLGTGKAVMSVEMFDQDTGQPTVLGFMFFHDPPNGEIIEQLRQIERATERRMIAVHKIRFAEDIMPPGQQATSLSS